MKITKILIFTLLVQTIGTLSFAVSVTSPTTEDYFNNVAYCNDPTHNCTAAQIATGEGGTSVWLDNGASGNGSGIICGSGQVWSDALGTCVSTTPQGTGSCTYMSGTNTVTQVSGASWACACSGSTVNLATCTCNNGSVTRNEAGCDKFTKYQVCPSNQCKTQSGSCFKNAPDVCVWESCDSTTPSSLPTSDSSVSSVATTHPLQ